MMRKGAASRIRSCSATKGSGPRPEIFSPHGNRGADLADHKDTKSAIS